MFRCWATRKIAKVLISIALSATLFLRVRSKSMCFDSLNSSNIASLIRISGEISRTSVAPPYTLARSWAKSDRGVSKNKLKHRFGIPLGNKTGKKWSRCFRAGKNQNASRCAIPAGGSQNVLRYAIPISTSQGRRAFRLRSPALLWIDGGRFCHRWCLLTS